MTLYLATLPTVKKSVRVDFQCYFGKSTTLNCLDQMVSGSTNKPFALSIQYLRHIEGKDLAARSVEEMRKQGLKDEKILTGWYNTLKNIFPDVENGSVLTAVFVPGQHTKFFSNDQEIGIVEGDEFLNWFSGIWLSEKTSEPELRQQLIGHS